MRRLDALDRLTARAENVGADRDQGQRALSLRPRSGAKSETSTSHHDLRVRPRLRATPRGSACVTGIQLLDTDAARRRRTRDCGEPMIDTLEKRLIEALKSVDAHGDVAPAHVHDPMTMLLRENAIQANLMRWDDVRGRYVLTGTGRRRTVEGSRAPGKVVSFRKRGLVGSGPLHRKSANTNLKE